MPGIANEDKKILSVIASATLLISLGACSSTHEARLPSDCNIPSLKALLPTLDLMYRDEPGNSKFLNCSTAPLDKHPSDALSQWKKALASGTARVMKAGSRTLKLLNMS